MLATRRWFAAVLSIAALCLLGAGACPAQTFRGAINGTVTDASGAVVPEAQITATDNGTRIVRSTLSSSAGEFSFPDLPLGQYTVSASANGFGTIKVNQVQVSAGSVYTLPIKLAIASSSSTVEVQASTLALDTTSLTQTTVLSSAAVKNIPLNGRDYAQM